VVKIIRFFSSLDSKRALEVGKEAGFIQGAHGAGRKKT
jgi:hypothetical protein